MPNSSHEDEIVARFIRLLDKSKQLFNGLRDLPMYGGKTWQLHFSKAFDVFTQLWKFQQQNRYILDTRYGLKRWQIGEIASKIGQLYYHYYIRTSETNYLYEAFSFYNAVRTRGYYLLPNSENRAELMIKKLRFYARFIVVCFLLRHFEMAEILANEFANNIEEFSLTMATTDQLEWHIVLDEIKQFINAESQITIVEMDHSKLIMSNRISSSNVPDYLFSHPFVLQEAVLVGANNSQVKFSEMTVDMYRMLQILEREPNEPNMDHPAESGGSPGHTLNMFNLENMTWIDQLENPRKYLLLKPHFAQLLHCLSSAFNNLSKYGVLFIYLSSDGGGDQQSDPNSPAATESTMATASKNANCFYPGDLYPFLRKPLFLIVDSDKATSFLSTPCLFAQPLVVLINPEIAHEAFTDKSNGSLFTQFLCSPLHGFCLVVGLSNVSVSLWDKGQTYVQKFLLECNRRLSSSKNVDVNIKIMMSDPFLRLIILRFIFCYFIFKMHKQFQGFLPQSSPSFPDDEVLNHPSLKKHIVDLADCLDVNSKFIFSNRLEKQCSVHQDAAMAAGGGLMNGDVIGGVGDEDMIEEII